MKSLISNNLLLFKTYFKYDKKFVMFNIVNSLLEVVYPLTQVLLMSMLIDSMFRSGSFEEVVKLILIVFVANAVKALFSLVFDNSIKPISHERVKTKVTNNLLNKYLRSDVNDLENADFYDNYTRVVKDFPERVALFQQHLANFISSLVAILAIATIIISLNPIILLITGVVIILHTFLLPIVKKIEYKLWLETTKPTRIKDYVKRIFYIPEYVKELKLYKVDKMFAKKYETASSNVVTTIKSFSLKKIFYIGLVAIVELGGLCLSLMYIGYYAIKGVFTMGGAVALLNGSEQFRSYTNRLFSVVPNLFENKIYVDNYLQFKVKQSIIENSNGAKVHDFETISFENVRFSYEIEADNLALNNINLSVTKNQKIALVGHNGAGKSTFLNLLLRLYDPVEGTIKVDGLDYKEIDTKCLRKNFMVILQDSQVYAMSIAESILMKKIENERDEKLVIDVLEKVGLYSKISSFKNGIHTQLTKEFDDDGIIMSGGEMQKLAVARVLASSAKIIVLDEVTSSMDAISEHEIFDMIEASTKDKTVIFISHKLSTTKMADVIYTFENGEIVEQGTHGQLIEKQGVYFDMFTTQAKKYS